MNESEHEQIQDDSHLVITDIPGSEQDVRGKASGLARLLQLPFRRRPSLHRSVLPLTIIASVVVIALIILGSFAAIRGITGLAIFGPAPAPTATLYPGDDLFYIQRSPAWGSIFIDGHTYARLPIIGVDQPIQLARGRHLIRWRADPFLTQHCIISVPPDITDTCLYNSSARVNANLSAWVIRLSLNLNMLPDEQRTALAQAAQAALDTLQSTETVRPGEQYADMSASHFMNVAAQPLRATLHFQLDTNPAAQASCVAQGTGQACEFQGVDCRLFCPTPDQAATVSSAQNAWIVLAVMRPFWDYATLDGKVVATNQPDSTDTNNTLNEYLVELHIMWNGTAWNVSVPGGYTSHATLPGNNTTTLSTGDPACATALDDIVSMGGYYSPAGGFDPADLRFDSGPKRADGCLVVETPQQNTQFSPSFPAIFLLHRFGIILAANDVAHRYLPFLPLADAYEQKLAQQLAT
jgi:hypothetical protein